jgi:hypothetical protein
VIYDDTAFQYGNRTLESGLEVLPWQDFLERLWAGELGV